MADTSGWNKLVDKQNIFETTQMSGREPLQRKPTHIVIHITGINDFGEVVSNFCEENGSVSAHYVIKKDGTLCQFVRDLDCAWHAGIELNIQKLYALESKEKAWMKYLRYFSWYKKYPSNAVYVTADLKKTTSDKAMFVMQESKKPWSKYYNYFEKRWSSRLVPIQFHEESDPNNYSIGIELVSYGSNEHHSNVYSKAMYKSLKNLLKNLHKTHGIPIDRNHIVGHEDVNPVARFGWDPNTGFDWDCILMSGNDKVLG